MMILGPGLFLLVFALLSSTVRAKTAECVIAVMHWINVYQPLSYVVVAIVFAAPILSYLLMACWPRTAEAENPLVQYRREHPDMME
jgi:hypothetical protein